VPQAIRLARRTPAWTITAAFAVLYLIAAPPSADLAAASYRANLFSRAGFTLWDNSWYGGHTLPAYSILAPALSALIGPQTLAALSAVVAVALFATLLEGRFPARATRIAIAWFAFGAAIELLSNRVPFDLGLTIALGAVLAAQRRHTALGFALTVLSSLASPVAGAFLGLVFLTWAIAGPERTRPGALTIAALAPVALLSIAFPEGGNEPFVASAFFPALAGTLVLAALISRVRADTVDREQGASMRVLRIGALLYALALTGSYLLASPVGGNVDRLGALVAGPVAACALAGGPLRARRTIALLVLAPLLTYWQAYDPVADFTAAQSDPAVKAAYYAPLLHELSSLGVGYGARPARIEVVATASHWEARWIAPHVMIARGWERQLDTYRNGLFYEGSNVLTPARYRTWLAQQAVSYVALPDARLDYSAKQEARVVRGQAGPAPFLREVWHSAHWRLFAVRGAQPLAQPPSVLSALGTDSLTLSAPRAGKYTVRVHFTPYWALASGSGCVERGPEDWTEIRALHAGSFHVVIDFSLARVLGEGPRCD
jgi:hypothetical protein